MNELLTLKNRRNWQLLTTVSAISLLTSTLTGARAGEAELPAIWIELGGQFTFINSPAESWIPPNLPPPIDHSVSDILDKRPRIGYEAEGAITLQPPAIDWTISIAARYGKAARAPKFAHDQTYEKVFNGLKYALTTYAFTDLHNAVTSNHLLLDFSVGKDVGIGLLNRDSASKLNFGVRIAQFHERAKSSMTALTSAHYKYPHRTSGGGYSNIPRNANLDAARSFSGIGPSISWNASIPVTGSLDDGLVVDWGANAALLFGRQKAHIRTHTEKIHFVGATALPYTHLISSMVTHSTMESVRGRTAIVPNLGAFAGLSYRVGGRGKVTLGYRADFFFGAMDGGINERKSQTVGFHGPFATISLGMGG
jgi:hypothetical protein